ncbi:MAG: porin family protein [Bdellovibrionota bacterium]
MKAIIVLLATAIMGGAAPMAMADASGGTGKFTMGPQGGMVWPNWSTKNSTVNRENKNGYMAGIFLEAGVWALTLRPEINYVEKGYTVSNVAEVKHHFLEIPVLLKFNPFAAGVVSPFIVIGPSWSKHLNTKTTVLGSTTTFNDNIDRWDVAGVAGAGIEFNLSEHVGLQLQARYNFGFRDIDSSTAEVKSRGLYGMGGLAFTL